ncbi:lipopolysaccharide assembly LapA domain-containing protein [Agrilactobacillus yilanensis]|uniref:Lipopolysaccharide assembly LapA domain-containing protein n=1 Tax=Agrilactobacillus yilanensis TaxID=2485997 RepID=A0ABW4J5Q5_9LACO|nr:lipopolysaccharide assembly protein LapA domain-containing protein [Agrilactobacillus yilanensis]
MNKQRNFVIALVIAIVLVIFALFNNDPVMINFVVASIKLPLIIILFICILLGALVTYLFATTGNYSTKKELKAMQGKVEQLETQQDQAIEAAVAENSEQFKAQLTEKDKEIENLKAELTDKTNTAAPKA